MCVCVCARARVWWVCVWVCVAWQGKIQKKDRVAGGRSGTRLWPDRVRYGSEGRTGTEPDSQTNAHASDLGVRWDTSAPKERGEAGAARITAGEAQGSRNRQRRGDKSPGVAGRIGEFGRRRGPGLCRTE